MRQVELERLDEQTTAAGHVSVAYQAPTLLAATEDQLPADVALPGDDLLPQVLPDQTAGDLAAPDAAGVVAWQAAIEQLLQFIGPDASSAALGAVEAVAPAALISPLDPGDLPVLAPSESQPAPAYVIESLPSGTPPLLSLDESDLFGDSGERSINLLSVAPGEPPALFEGMDLDLFGSPENGINPVKVADRDTQRQPHFGGPPKPEPIPDGEGYISLLGKPSELKLTMDSVREHMSQDGQLFIDGDADDRVYISGGEWIFDRSDKGASYYTDVSGTIELTVHNSEVVVV